MPRYAQFVGRMFVGIDLGADAVHLVAVDEALEVKAATVLPPTALDELFKVVGDARCIAVDAPSALSSRPHLDDRTLAAKFRSARCAEIALGRDHRLWVPWATPHVIAGAPKWMTIGLSLHAVLAEQGHRVIEVYPHAGFKKLADGGRLPGKRTPGGIRERARLLRSAGIRPPWLEAWSHDSLDAAIASLIARFAHAGTARAVGCGHDASAIWLPSMDTQKRP